LGCKRGDCDGEVRADDASAAVAETLDSAGEDERDKVAAELAIMAAAEGEDVNEDEAEADEDAVGFAERLEDDGGGGEAGRYERRAKCCASVKICWKLEAKRRQYTEYGTIAAQ
jgi:hypothetical protein